MAHWKLATAEGGVLVGSGGDAPEGAAELTDDEYAAELAAARSAVLAAAEAAQEAAGAARREQAAEDYAALTTAGIPAATAARLTGYEGGPS